MNLRSNANILFSCENEQEYKDILEIIKSGAESFNWTLYYYSLDKFYQKPIKCSDDEKIFQKTLESIGYTGRGFRELGWLLKLMFAILNAFTILYYSWKLDARILVTGTPLVPHRLARILSFGRLKVVSYIRGIIAHSGEATSLSSKIFHIFKNFSMGEMISRYLSDYYSDVVLCTGRITYEFMFNRRVPISNIKIIGSVYCDRERNLDISDVGDHKTIVFISSALAFHGYVKAQQLQTEMILEIQRFLNNAEKKTPCKFIVRTHPRESEDTYLQYPQLTSCIEGPEISVLSAYPKNTLFISPISTMVYELHCIGRSSCLATTTSLFAEMENWYQAMGYKVFPDWKKFVQDYLQNGSISPLPQMGYALSNEFNGKVANKGAEIIEELTRGNLK